MRALWIHPDDNYSPVATGGVEWVAQTGAASSDPNYGLTKLGDLNAATRCKCTNAGPFAIVRDLGSAKRIDFAIIPMHTCDAGGTVLFQLHSSSAWGAPDVSIACVVPTWLSTRPPMPQGLVFDLRGVADATRTRRYVRVSAPANAANNLAFGEIVFGIASELPRNINWGLKEPRRVATARKETPLGGRLGTYLGTLRRWLSGSIKENSNTGLAMLTRLYDTAADVTPFGFVLDPTVVDGRFVYWDSPFEPTRDFLDLNPIDLTLVEQSRGRPF